MSALWLRRSDSSVVPERPEPDITKAVGLVIGLTVAPSSARGGCAARAGHSQYSWLWAVVLRGLATRRCREWPYWSSGKKPAGESAISPMLPALPVTGRISGPDNPGER